MPHEFYCRDCGHHVMSFRFAEDHRCVQCEFIAQLPTEDERAAVRTALYDAEQMQNWRRWGCYRDESFPERLCDLCGKPFRGPAVYCCLDCASVAAA